MAPSPVRVPHAVGFDDLTLIGRGGFASVYRATESAFARDIALKVINVNVSGDAQQRFERECRAIGAVSAHPNIVSVFGAGTTDDGSPYIAMELLTGGSLGERLDHDGPLGWEEVVDIGAAIARAVQAAHDRGVLHRDIKPDNILVSEYGEPKLADFGISSIAGGFQTRSGMVSGSLAHTAPEVLDGAPATVASDVYALASTLYTLLVGQPPFVRAGEEGLAAVIARTVRDAAPRVAPAVAPSEVADVLDAALSKDPSDRPLSAAALAEDLDACRERPVRAAKVAARRDVEPPTLPADHSAASSTFQVRTTMLRQRHGYAGPPPLPDEEPRRSRRGLVIATAIVLLAAVGGTAVALTHHGHRVPPPPPAAPVALAPLVAPSVTVACAGLACTLTPAALGTGQTLQWSYGDGATAQTAQGPATHTFAKPGTYAASVVLVDGSRSSPAGSVPVTIAAYGRTATLQVAKPVTAMAATLVVSAQDSCRDGHAELQEKSGASWKKVGVLVFHSAPTRTGTLRAGAYRAVIAPTGVSGGVCAGATTKPVTVVAPVVQQTTTPYVPSVPTTPSTPTTPTTPTTKTTPPGSTGCIEGICD